MNKHALCASCILWFQKPFLKSPSGPVIHELDPAEYATVLLDTVNEDDVDDLSYPQSDQFITVEQ